MHAALRITLGHFLVKDAAAGGHPLHVAGGHLALVSKAVAVLDRAGEHVGDRLNPPVRMPRKSGEVIFRVVIAKIVQQQKRVEILRFTEAESALQPHASALDRGLRLNNLFDWAE